MPLSATAAAEVRLSDIELAREIGGEDRNALAQLMRRHNQMLYRTARSILKDEAEAEDAVQEAYIRAYQGIGGYRGAAKLSTWLVRIVVNESIARLRRRNRSAQVIALDGELTREPIEQIADRARDPNDTPEQTAMRAEVRRMLEKAVDSLPLTLRTVFVLRAVEDMSVEETAAALEIPAATVRTRLFRARGLLREALKSEIDLRAGDAFAFAGDRCERIVAAVLARLADGTGRRPMALSSGVQG